MRRTLLLALLVLSAGPADATAMVRVDGRGFGHGVGLAQYGAYGYARHGQDFRWILRHYYPGATVGTGPSARLRVRLKELSALRVVGATRARGADGRTVTLRATWTYRLSPWGAEDELRVVHVGSTHAVAHLHATVRLTGPAPMRLLGIAENGVSDGRYRGALLIRRDAEHVMAIDDVSLEQYLLGVVGSEMPSNWPSQALRAQAVAARSYALRSRRPAEPFDVFADTRSQVYRGVTGESAGATSAVDATHGLAVLWQGQVAETLFSSSSGGRTAAVQDAFPGSPPVPYLRPVDDPYDTLSPYHAWTVTFSDADAAARLAPVLAGALVDVAVVATTPEGRAATVRVTGTLGVRDVDANTIRSLLQLRSTWFAIAR